MEIRAVFKVSWISTEDSESDDGEIYYEDLNRALEQFEGMTKNEVTAKYYEGVLLFVLVLRPGVTVTDILNGNETDLFKTSVLLKDWSR